MSRISSFCRSWTTLAGVGLALIFSAGVVLADPLKVPDRLIRNGKMTVCSALDIPPIIYYDDKQNAVGMSADVANDLAKQFGNLKVEWRAMPFAGLVLGLLARQCDLIIDQLFDKPQRREVINIVDYMWASSAIVTPYANVKKVHALSDLSGLKVAALTGSTIGTLLDEQNKKFQATGQTPMTIVVFGRDVDAFQALRLGQVDAYGSTVETAAYYEKLSPNAFVIAASGFFKMPTGVGIRKDDPEMTAAVSAAVEDLVKSERYSQMLKKWGVELDRWSH